MSQTTDKMREAFERTLSDGIDTSGCAGTNMNFKTGVRKEVWLYHNGRTQAAWEGYQAALASRQAEVDALVAERDRLLKILNKSYTMLVEANMKNLPQENQRCGRCDYCDALLPNADDDDCGECYEIVRTIAESMAKGGA